MSFRHKQTRRGFATFTAVVLVGTTAIVLTAVAGITIRQAQRTKHATHDAQLRQLLLAGQAYLQSQALKTNEFNEIDLPLPEAIGGERRVTIRYEHDPDLVATIQATYNQRQATTLLVATDDGGWQIRNVQMP